MQAQATEQSMSTSRPPLVRKPFTILVMLALVGLGIYGYTAGWFKDVRGKAGDLFAAVTISVGDFFNRNGNPNSTVPPTSVASVGTTDQVTVAAAPAQPSGDAVVNMTGNAASNDFPAIGTAPGAEELLTRARGALAAGDIDAAIEGYRALIAANPEDFGAIGELGNVFYANGMLPAAAQAFFDVANQALDQGQFELAANLLPAIAAGNPMLATLLNHRLFEAYARSNMGQPEQQMPAMYQPYPQAMPPFMQQGGW